MGKKNILRKDKPAATSGRASFALDFDTVPEPHYVAAASRSYLLTSVSTATTAARSVSAKDLVLLVALVVLAVALRLRALDWPNSVVFDEVHFGGFALKYIQGKFFMDVHPPLVKLMFAWIAQWGGFTGDFAFEKIGDVFPPSVPYVLMRLFPAVLGVFTVVLAYLTLRSSGVRPAVAFAAASCLNMDNSHITISRYILLDSPLLFFIAAAVYALKKFEVQQPFSLPWFRSLFSCGVALGFALSSKWVGLFTLAWVGISCVIHMWFLIGDLNVSLVTVIKHAAARVSVLLALPVAIYLYVFSIHFTALPNNGLGSGFMSPAFKFGMEDSNLPRSTTAQVGFGSVVTLRHVNTRAGYLHSHNHVYPAGSQQQQVTLYPHIDANNEWLIEPYNMSMPTNFTAITDGMKIRLKHIVSQKRLHSHDEKPPVSERDWQKEVSCYGFDNFQGDPNDDWVVEIIKHKTPEGEAQETVKAIDTIFRLRHAMSGNYLFSCELKLPEWGFGQQEVTAAGQGARPLTHWFIETNSNDLLAEEEKEEISYRALSFWEKLWESHKVMFDINDSLTTYHAYQSSPHFWPLLTRGINYWYKDRAQIYFIGNPVVWWSSTVCLIAFAAYVLVSILKWQTGKNVAANKNVFNFNAQMFSYFAGWLVHYAPFYIMGRLLFLHHYIPAYYFAILGLGHVLDLLVSATQKYGRAMYSVIAVYLTLALAAYYSLSPLIDGQPWLKKQCASSKLLSSWDYNCEERFESWEEYNSFTPSAATASTTSSVNVINEASHTVQTVSAPLKKAEPSVEEVVDNPPPAETHKGQIPSESFPGAPVEEPHAEQEDTPTIEKNEQPSEAIDTVGKDDEVAKEITDIKNPQIAEPAPAAAAQPVAAEPAPAAEPASAANAENVAAEHVDAEHVAEAVPAPAAGAKSIEAEADVKAEESDMSLNEVEMA